MVLIMAKNLIIKPVRSFLYGIGLPNVGQGLQMFKVITGVFILLF